MAEQNTDGDQTNGTDQAAVRKSPASAARLRKAWLNRRQRLNVSAPRGTRRAEQAAPWEKAAATGHVHPTLMKGSSKFASSGWHNLSSTNIYGLTSRSEQMFPEAYRPIQDKHWLEIGDEERFRLTERQISAMKKVGFRDTEEIVDTSTAADNLYEEAVGRRRQAIRRRLSASPPKRYQDRKKWEEERRKQPLQRRYVARGIEQLEDTQFYKASSIDIPVLIQGVLKRLNHSPEATPKRLKLKRPRYQQEKIKLGQAKVPTIETAGAAAVGINMWNNRFGLQSSAVSSYPEAYREVSSVYWRQVSREHHDQMMLVQAQAMEKVGFERKTEKYFIKDFDPSLENLYDMDSDRDEVAAMESRYDADGTGGYDPEDKEVSLQNRFADQEFIPAKLKDLGFKLSRPVNMQVGTMLLVVAMVALAAGIARGMNPWLWGVVLVSGLLGAGMSLRRV